MKSGDQRLIVVVTLQLYSCKVEYGVNGKTMFFKIKT